jgi:type II secretory pathway pseudopilin PulG
MRRIRRFTGIYARVSSGRRKRRGLGRLGFTVLELFIVMEIIAFLATIVMANYFRSKKAAQVAVTVQNIKNVQVALTSYMAMEGEFPPSLNSIWLQFYGGRVVDDFDYIGGTTAGNQGGWDFFASNSADIKFNGPTNQGYAIRSKKNLLPYALYVYGDVATSAKIVH